MSGVHKAPAKQSPFLAACEVDGAEFTFGDEDNDVRKVTVQLVDANGQNVVGRHHVQGYISGDAEGDNLATAPTTVAISEHGLMIEEISNSRFTLVTNAAGVVDFNITKAGAANYYIVLLMPTGKLVVSSILAFAA